MAKSNYISMPVIRRLPRYYRHLTTLKNRGINITTSLQLTIGENYYNLRFIILIFY